MAKRTEDYEIDPAIVPIDDDSDTSPAAMDAWLATLHHDEPVNLSLSAAAIVRNIRERGASRHRLR
jgi:hypothetical protein